MITMKQKEEIDLLRKKFISLNSEEDRKRFDKEFEALYYSKSETEKREFQNSFVQSANDECKKADELYNDIRIKLRLEQILDIVSMSYIAEHYFRKSRSWLSQRINSHAVNGNPVSFNKDELNILSHALNEIGDKVKEVARSI